MLDPLPHRCFWASLCAGTPGTTEPGEWEKALDDDGGVTWFNITTGEWYAGDSPPDVPSPSNPPSASPGGPGGLGGSAAAAAAAKRATRGKEAPRDYELEAAMHRHSHGLLPSRVLSILQRQSCVVMMTPAAIHRNLPSGVAHIAQTCKPTRH